RVYGHVSLISGDSLLLSEAELAEAGFAPELAREVMARSGGWACLFPAVAQEIDDAALADFIADEVLPFYPSAALVAGRAHLEAPQRRIDPRLLSGLPFIRPCGPLHPALEATRGPMCEAIARTL